MATMTSGLSDAGDKAVNADVVERVSLLVASGIFRRGPACRPLRNCENGSIGKHKIDARQLARCLRLGV